MPLAYIRPLNPVGPLALVEIIELSPGSPPPRPHPQPPDPPLGIWGPGDPRPTLPIAGWNPITGAWPKPPAGTPPGTQVALVAPVPPPADGSPPPPPPAGMSPDSKQVAIRLASGESYTAWSEPYATTGPVTPPPDPVPC